MRIRNAWWMAVIATVVGCGAEDNADNARGGVMGGGAGGSSAPANPALGMTPAGMQPPMTPVGMVPVAGGNPMAGGGAMMAGTGGMMMAGRGGMGGRGGSGMPMAGSGMAGAAGMAGSGMAGAAGTAGSAGSAPPDGCVENLTCQLMAPPSTGDVHQDCVDRINQFRIQCACLPALARWTEAEACADMMAEYDSTQPTAHAGFRARICMPGGSSQNECPGWRSETQIIGRCLQSMWDEGPPPMQPCEGDCFQTYGHFINMTSTRSTKVACGFFTTADGEIWSVQNFTR